MKITERKDELSIFPLPPIVTFTIALLLALLIWGGECAYGVHTADEVPTTIVETTTTPIETTTEQVTTTKPVTTTAGTTEAKSTTTFRVSAYCACTKCCGKSDGITASGTKATQGRTIAVDPRVIPFGTNVVINGYTYVAEDTGGSIKGNRIDMYFDTHSEALQFGVQYCEVVIL